MVQSAQMHQRQWASHFEGFRAHSPFGRQIPLEGRLKVHKVATKENPADILTNCGEGRHAEAQALDIELGTTA